jgi:hypothetical protein
MQSSPPVFNTIDWYDSFYSGIYGSKTPRAKVIGFKETFGGAEAIEWTKSVLKNIKINSSLPIKIISIVRDPIQSYLSNISGHKNHWAKDDKSWEPSAEDFINFALIDNLYSISELCSIHEEYNGVFLSYKQLTERPQSTLSSLMKFIGLDFHLSQLEFPSIINKLEIMGDQGLAENPKRVSSVMYFKRAFEAMEFERQNFDELNGNNHLRVMKELVGYFDANSIVGCIPEELMLRMRIDKEV